MSLNPRTFTDKTNEALQKAEEVSDIAIITHTRAALHM